MKLLSILFSPLVFALGFLAPMIAQILLASSLVESLQSAYLMAFAIAVSLGLMAQFRGSWLWIK